jgi:LysR family glycine cleavage system transcriptional activator
MIKRFSLLQAFVAVARSGKMKDAAGLLAITPGAVSMRIRQLEQAAGQALFVRVRGGVELSEAGRLMFASLDQPFRDLEVVDRELEGGATRRRIVVSTMPSFAAMWLVPRLEGFSRLHPEVEVVLETSSALVDLKRDPVDLAVRHGLGRYAGLESKWLVAPELIVVGSPALLERGPPIERPADCLNYPLLHGPRRKDWPTWFEALGVPAPNAAAGHAFSERQLIIAAAIAGQGLALAHDVDARAALRSGQLVRPLTTSWPAEIAYYAVATPESLSKPIVRRFRDWLVEEALRDPGGLH